MRVTGLDLSLTSTGVAHWNSVGVLVTEAVQPKLTPGPDHDHRRLDCLLHEVGQQTKHTDFAAIEGPSFGSPNKQHAMGGLWWLVAHGLWRRRIPYVVITPHQRAKYITGKASAGKVEVALAAAKRYPGADFSTDDEADALVLAVMAADYLGLPFVAPVPKAQREVLDHVQWPLEFQDVREVRSAQATANG